MSVQLSVAVRNAQNDAMESAIGTAPKLQIRTGAQPSDCAQAASGTLLAELTLPSDWLTASSSGTKSKNGTWSGTAVGTGTAGHYRIYDSAGTNCHEQGSVTTSGGGGDMIIDNASIASGQTVTVSSYSRAMGNA